MHFKVNVVTEHCSSVLYVHRSPCTAITAPVLHKTIDDIVASASHLCIEGVRENLSLAIATPFHLWLENSERTKAGEKEMVFVCVEYESSN